MPVRKRKVPEPRGSHPPLSPLNNAPLPQTPGKSENVPSSVSVKKRKVPEPNGCKQLFAPLRDDPAPLPRTPGKGGKPPNWVMCYCDTETTGLVDAYVVQFALVCYDLLGNLLLEVNQLCKPRGKITAGATGVHHITDAHVQDAPSLSSVLKDTAEQLEVVCAPGAQRVLVTYNGDSFDIPAIVRHLSWENAAEGPTGIFRQLRFHSSVDLLVCLPQLNLTLTPTFTRTGRVNTDPTKVKLTVLYEQVLRQTLDKELTAHDARGDCLILKAIVHDSKVLPEVVKCLEGAPTAGVNRNLLQVVQQLGRNATRHLPALLTLISSTSKEVCRL